ncbi:MAG TPA: SGNH/GDSL hydrolase family protein [Fimbriimonadaceae bacterium]|nr:SGNH/GDSL hydrolase family protein [Fimbriimonadaceae bacterium]
MVPFLLPLALAQSSGGFALHDGDRVLFYGDSITDNQFYPQYVENYVLTRFPNLRVSFVNYGWSGDRVTGGGGGDIEKRLSRDVFPWRPTVVTIMLGMNDGLYRPWDDNAARVFESGYEHILDELKTHGDPRVTIIKPSPYDDITLATTGYNTVLQRFGDFLGGLATKVGATVADFNAPVVDLLNKAKATDPEGARKLIPDRVHPSPAAHMVMGDALLRAWNAPSLVSAVQIDAGAPSVTTDNATVRDLKAANGAVSWRELDGSLPVYFDRDNSAVDLVLKSSTVFEDADQEPLKVTNLAAGSYTLTIDGENDGQFTADQLGNGVNLAELKTPMMKQSQTVAAWTARRQFVRQTAWRNLLVDLDGLGLSQRENALRSMDRLEAEIVDRQRQSAKPVWHIFKLDKAG